MSRSLWLSIAIASTALAVPASAQAPDRNVPAGGLARNQAECIAQFQEADLNNDNFLSSFETRESRALIPSDLSNERRITRREFLSACNARIDSSRSG